MRLKKSKERDACEEAILNHLLAIQKIYRKYNPDGRYLNMSFGHDDCHISVNNAHWDNDKDFPIDFYYINGVKGSVYE